MPVLFAFIEIQSSSYQLRLEKHTKQGSGTTENDNSWCQQLDIKFYNLLSRLPVSAISFSYRVFFLSLTVQHFLKQSSAQEK